MNAAINNPFIVKGAIPEQYFCDRKEETELLKSHLVNGRNVLLVSPRRMGKTGLIEHAFCQPEIRDDFYTVFVDILETSSLREFTYLLGRQVFDALKSHGKEMVDLFVSTVRSISGELGYDASTGFPRFSLSLGTIRNPEYTLEEIFEYLDKADKRCVVAIDEFQQIAYYPERNTEALLRSYIQRQQNADFIFAGSERHTLSAMFNTHARPFYASTTNMSLSPISLEAYQDFVCRCFSEFGKGVDVDTVGHVYGLLGANTYCMQRVFNNAFAVTGVGECCSLDTVAWSVRDILRSDERIFQSRLSLLSTKPKELLYAIASEGAAQGITSAAFVRRHHLSSASSVQTGTKLLEREDWISYSVNERGQKTYALQDPFLRLWICDHFGNGWEL